MIHYQPLVRFLALFLLCLSSAAAYYYLNVIAAAEHQKSLAAAPLSNPKVERQILITDPKTQKQQLIVIAPPQWIDTSEMVRPAAAQNKKQEEPRSILPDVELFKFVLLKGREGIPVLSIGNLINFGG